MDKEEYNKGFEIGKKQVRNRAIFEGVGEGVDDIAETVIRVAEKIKLGELVNRRLEGKLSRDEEDTKLIGDSSQSTTDCE